jgi:hypothetical protein
MLVGSEGWAVVVLLIAVVMILLSRENGTILIRLAPPV